MSAQKKQAVQGKIGDLKKGARAYRVPVQQPQAILPAALQLAVEEPQAARPETALQIQQRYGNDAVSSLVQPKLMVGPAGDQYEQEADRVAEQLMSSPNMEGHPPALQRQQEEEGYLSTTQVQRQPEEEEYLSTTQVQRQEEEEYLSTAQVRRQEEDELIQGSPLAQRRVEGGFEAGSKLESQLAGRKGGGSSLPRDFRAFVEPRFGVDFGGVRVHTDREAVRMSQDLSAQAFTHGQDIYFGAGRYDPGSEAGQRLLAHELTHVVQQTDSVQGQRKRGMIQRSLRWNVGTVANNIDPTANYLQFNYQNGFTPPLLNGSEIMNANQARQAIDEPVISGRLTDDGDVEVWVSKPPANVGSYNMYLPTAGPWRHAANKRQVYMVMGGQPPQLNAEGQTTFEVMGDPDHQALSQEVENHEAHHAADHLEQMVKVLLPWDAKLEKAAKDQTRFRGATPDEAEAALYRAMGGTAAQKAARLDHEWGEANNRFHDTPAGKTNIQETDANENGSQSWVVVTLP